MVVKADGTKWACQSCLKGHRVSGCTHTDRELQLVPKKGRPVTQCQHCRTERKKRSAHVSCQCGENDKQPHHSKEKCIHLREAEERAKAGIHEKSNEIDPAHRAAVAELQGCCCSHGGKCSCCLLKKELDELPHGPAVKPRLESSRSEGTITVFQNGHHKPVHRKNHAAHECGMPYKMPLPRVYSEQSSQKTPRRSVDSLALDMNISFNPAPFASQSKMKSEKHSPNLDITDPMFQISDAEKLNQMDFSAFEGLTRVSDQNVYTAEPMSALTDDGFNPWSAIPTSNSMPNNNHFGVWPTTFDAAMIQPALTAASSGTQSEIDEIPAMDDFYSGFGMPSIQEDAGFNANGTQGPGSPQVNRRSLPPNFWSPNDFNSAEWNGIQEDLEAFAETKPLSTENSPSAFDDAWQMPNLSSSMVESHISPRTGVFSTFVPGRPASQSVGAANAPAPDIMHQLFPEMDSMFIQQPGVNLSSNTSTPPLEFGPLDISGFKSQSWVDGVPTDFDFSNPAFSTGQ